METTHLFFREQFSRHLKHPGFWLVIILSAIGARYMVPLPDAKYVTLSVNSAYPTVSASVIGMQMGIVTALLLSPLAYVFLRAGPTRRQPWQIQDVTPASRLPQMLGFGLGDAAILLLLMGVLGVAGVILSLFRLPLSEVNPVLTFVIFSAIAAPALIVTAAVRTFFSARPMLRGAWGDVLFFVFWMGANIVAITAFDSGDTNPFVDVYGYMAAIFGSADVEVHSATIGSVQSKGEFITLNPLNAVFAPSFLLSRLLWVVVAIVAMVLAGVLFKARQFKSKTRTARLKRLNPVATTISSLILTPILGVFAAVHPMARSTLTLILQNRWLLLFLAAVSIAGFFLPLRRLVGPAMILGLTFAFSRYSAEWQARHMRQYLQTQPVSQSTQLIGSILIAMVLCLALLIPALVKATMDGALPQLKWDFLALIIVFPAFTILSGFITRSATLGRFVNLCVWYAYLNVG